MSPGDLAAHSVFMTFRNCFVTPSNAWNPSQRLQQCPRDCFRKPLAISPGALAAHSVFTTFRWHLKCLEPLAAPPAMPRRLLRKASHAMSPGELAAHSVFMTFRNCSLAAPPAVLQRLLWKASGELAAHSVFMTFRNCSLAALPAVLQRLLRKASHAMSPGELAAHSVFMTFRNCSLAAPPAVPQRLLRKASHAISPGALAAHSVFMTRLLQKASRHLTWRLGRTLCFYDLPLAPQMLGTPRSASSSAPETASEGFSRHVTWRIGRTLCFYTFQNCFLAPSNAWNPSQRLQQCPRDCFRRPLAISPGALAAHSVFMTFRWHLKCLEPLAAPPAVLQRLLRKVSHAMSPGALAAHSVFMTFRNCFLAPSNAWNPSQRLQQCPRDCFRRPLAISPGALAAHSVFMTFRWHLKCLEPLAAPPAVLQRLLRKASHAMSPGELAARSVFMTFRNCSLAAPPAVPPSPEAQSIKRGSAASGR